MIMSLVMSTMWCLPEHGERKWADGCEGTSHTMLISAHEHTHSSLQINVMSTLESALSSIHKVHSGLQTWPPHTTNASTRAHCHFRTHPLLITCPWFQSPTHCVYSLWTFICSVLFHLMFAIYVYLVFALVFFPCQVTYAFNVMLCFLTDCKQYCAKT